MHSMFACIFLLRWDRCFELRTSSVALSWCAVSWVYDWLPWKHILYSLGVKREREREMMMAWRRGKVGDGLYREKQKKENKWKQTGCGRRGLGYLLSTPLSTSFTVSPSISLSLSFCFLVPFLPFLCLLKEKAGEEGANVRETEREG